VTILERGSQLLPREDRDAAAIVRSSLERDGVVVKTDAAVTEVRGNGAALIAAYRNSSSGNEAQDATETVAADSILVATGRKASIEGLGLDAAEIQFDHNGIRVDDRLRTTNRRVYAAGDVASKYRFTHAADALARIVIQNALFFGRKSGQRLIVPWCTFTSPEVAHVGLNALAAHKAGAQTITIPLEDVDRAVVDRATAGFVRIHHQGGTICGATIVGAGAGDVIGTVAYAMQREGSLAELSRVVFPYPTLSLALRQAADAYQRSRLTAALKRALQYYFRVWR
jgi:pyruvate/2-oxoglutarate dehydrogenase complex dihydrolipoamide dehydrogenase (E3) component